MQVSGAGTQSKNQNQNWNPHCGGLASCLVLEPKLLLENMYCLFPPWGRHIGEQLSLYKIEARQREPTLWVPRWVGRWSGRDQNGFPTFC